jgi:hypothetical protein
LSRAFLPVRGAGSPRCRTAHFLGLAAFVALAGCDDSPSEPQDPTPQLTNFSYTVLALSLPECPPNGLADGTQFRWTIEFSDPDGDVVPPVLMEWSTSFNPSGTTKSALLLIPATAIVPGEGSGGAISQTQCIRFGEQESVDITLSIYDEVGHHSNPRTLRIMRPAGAL